jgi:hypothetical protein
MENVKVLFIATPWRAQSHRWELNNDGLVEYNDELITPKEVADRFESDYPMFKILRAEVCERIVNTGDGKPFQWIELERFV